LQSSKDLLSAGIGSAGFLVVFLSTGEPTDLELNSDSLVGIVAVAWI
jgi:hypothetical protein